jgi:hypothetical protein
MHGSRSEATVVVSSAEQSHSLTLTRSVEQEEKLPGGTQYRAASIPALKSPGLGHTTDVDEQRCPGQTGDNCGSMPTARLEYSPAINTAQKPLCESLLISGTRQWRLETLSPSRGAHRSCYQPACENLAPSTSIKGRSILAADTEEMVTTTYGRRPCCTFVAAVSSSATFLFSTWFQNSSPCLRSGLQSAQRAQEQVISTYGNNNLGATSCVL